MADSDKKSNSTLKPTRFRFHYTLLIASAPSLPPITRKPKSPSFTSQAATLKKRKKKKNKKKGVSLLPKLLTRFSITGHCVSSPTQRQETLSNAPLRSHPLASIVEGATVPAWHFDYFVISDGYLLRCRAEEQHRGSTLISLPGLFCRWTSSSASLD